MLPLTGFAGYVAYVMDRRDKGNATMHDVPIVREYPNVFPEELPEIHPERQVEFRIDLVRSADPLAKAQYRLDPPEMQKWSTQLQELLGKGIYPAEQFSRGSPNPFCEEEVRVTSDVYRLPGAE